MPPPTAKSRRTSLLFVNQHYWPDVASTGQHLTDLAEHLAARGFDVEVLSGGAHYVGGMVDAPAREVRGGVRITRVRGTTLGRRTHLGRLLDYATTYAGLSLRVLMHRRRACVIYLTTPPLLPALGWIARAVRGQPYAVWAMDLHPEAEVAAGMLSPTASVARLLTAIAGRSYRKASFVVALGAYMRRRLAAHGVEASRLRTVPVWSDAREIVPTPDDANPLIEELGLRGRFVVMYSGNAGVVHDFDAVLEAMRRLRNEPRVFFLFVGNGPRRSAIEQYAGDHGIRNFAYRDYFPRERLAQSLSVADVHLMSLRAPFVGISVPGKLYGVMAAGRPAIFIGPERCETADAIRDAQCGVIIDPASVADAAGRIVDVIRAWCDVPAVVREMGRRARAAFEEHYERRASCEAFERAICDAWGSPMPTPVESVGRRGRPRASGRSTVGRH